jgi:DNA-directed RNA polymerase subunit RPC12/RpoP
MSRILKPTPYFFQTRDIFTLQTRDIKILKNPQNIQSQPELQPTSEKTFNCPYCQGKDIVKKGVRQKKLETVQLFYCNDCKNDFTPQKLKGK